LLTNGDNNYRAIVHFVGSVEAEGVIDRMIERGSTITKADALTVLQEYHAAIGVGVNRLRLVCNQPNQIIPHRRGGEPSVG
jgi:hypothetical protein